MNELKLELDHTYLVRYVGHSSGSVSSITILVITGKAYHVRWNNGLESATTWELKEEFDYKYSVVEDISDFVVEPREETTLRVETKLVNCFICHGMGTVPDPKSTAGITTCPHCLGAKMIPEVVTIS